MPFPSGQRVNTRGLSVYSVLMVAHIHDCIIIGAGQAGLSTAFYLQRRGITPVILDNQPGPGAAWRHVWPSMTLFSTPGFSNMSGMPMPSYHGPGDFPDAQHVIDYFTAYEQRYGFDIRRPVDVLKVNADTADGFVLDTSEGEFRARTVVAATGTWSAPFVPFLPGTFRGRQRHSATYAGPEEFRGKKVAVVGGANSGAQIAAELTDVAEVTWFTRHEPRWMPDDVDGRVLFQRNRARAQAVLAGEDDPGGDRSLGEIVMLPKVLEARDSGALRATPMFESLDELTEAGFDELVWCTGFRPAVRPFRELVRTTDSGRLHSAVSGFYLVGLGETTGPGSGTIMGVQPFAREVAGAIAEELG